MRADWMEILNKVKNGELSVEEGVQQMEGLEGNPKEFNSAAASKFASDEAAPFEDHQAQVAEVLPGNNSEPADEDFQPEIGRWKDAWLIPFWVGTGVFTLSALWMGWAISTRHSFSTYCAGVPMLFGLLLLFLGWWSRQAHWVHVRVQESSGTKVAVSIPLPLRLASWLLRVFTPLIPKLRQQNLENLPDMLDELGKAEGPLAVEVDEEGGDRVRVYIL